MTSARVGKRGSLVIPVDERRKARIEQGDIVDVTAQDSGLLVIKRMLSLGEIQAKVAGRLPQWSVLEGKADKLLENEVKRKKKKKKNERTRQLAK